MTLVIDIAGVVWLGTTLATAVVLLLMLYEQHARLPYWQGRLRLAFALYLIAAFIFIALELTGVDGNIRAAAILLGAFSGIGALIHTVQYRRWTAAILRAGDDDAR